MDSETFNIVTMVLGAILGGTIAPVGNEIVRRLFRRENRQLGLHSAILFLLFANGTWILGDATVNLIYMGRDFGYFSGEGDEPRTIGFAIAWIVSLCIFALAATSLWIAYQHIPETPGKINLEFLEGRRGPLALLILGNLLWILGAAISVLSDALTDVTELPLYWYSYFVELIVYALGIFLFLRAVTQVWRRSSSA